MTTSQIQNYPQKLCDFVQNDHCAIPNDILQEFPPIRLLASQVTIHVQRNIDKLIWKNNGNGTLTLKEAYNFKKNNFPKLPWAKIIWSKDIPHQNHCLSGG